MALHPVADEVEDTWRDALLEKGHASGLTDLIAEVPADCGAQGRDSDQEKPIVVAGG